MDTFSERFRHLKDESGKILKEISEDTKITVANLSYYMNGREPKYEVLCIIANYFNVTTDYLVGYSNQKNSVEELKAQNIQSRSDTNILSSKYQLTIENYSVKLHDLLIKLDALETNDDKLEDVWESVKLWLEGFEIYCQYIEQYNLQNSYPLDEARKAMEKISDSRTIAGKRVSDMLKKIMTSNTIDKEIKERVIMRSTFGIRPKEQIDKTEDID